jgi:DNA-binding transcriptional regulator YhcF (GntR family)
MNKEIIKINTGGRVPKYKQIVDSIHIAVEHKTLKKGQQILSINQLCGQFSLSRETALTAYKELKSRGIISSAPGKGYFIATDKVQPQHKIFLLFDELNAFKQVLYDAIIEKLADKGKVEIYFHHYNPKVFETLLLDNLGNYTSYVLMPIPDKKTVRLLESIPSDNIYLLDVGRSVFKEKYPAVYQNFEHDITNGLLAGLHLLKKFERLTLVFAEETKNPKEIKAGFKKFCDSHHVQYEIISSAIDRQLKIGDAYLVIDDKDLVHLLKEARKAGFKTGTDIGIISFNDTPLKEVVAEGITTISTNFAAMGRDIIDMVINRKKKTLLNPSSLIERHSL